MTEFTYFLILFFTVIVCFVASFDKRLQFYKHFAAFIKAATVVAIPFILWDIWFTIKGVWWFNLTYTTGITLAGLPVEEWLFFFCIPFSCMFTYFCFDKFFKLAWTVAFNNIIVFAMVIVSIVIALLHFDKTYTFVTAVVATITLIYLHFLVRASWIGRASLVFLILIPGFLAVNGILTGTGLEAPIVNYNPNEFLGIRVLSIPIEDAVYGYTQFLLVLYFFKMFQQPAKNKERNKVVLVDENDQALGVMDKLEAHEKGKMHRAFSVFIFNEDGQMLIHQRALHKYHGSGLWTNACCSHPQWDEDVKESAEERLAYEMGISCSLSYRFSFSYQIAVENNLIEHEFDYVFTGLTNKNPVINRKEVMDYRWIYPADLQKDILIQPNKYTFWFKEILPQLMQKLTD